jgi:adenosylcobinamide-phosphate synthase
MSALAAAAGVAADRLLGEPPVRWHPVARYGQLMLAVERRLYADRRRNGVLFALVGATVAGGVGLALRRAVGPTAATALATAVCVAGRMLDDEARAIAALLPDRLPEARERVRSLVGRDTADLDAAEISRAVIESVAENCVDAVTASLCWAAVGGAPAVLAHRAVNTLDAMVGHHDARYERFGWASARLDDAINWLPARLTGAAVAVVRPSTATTVWRVVRRDAPQHPAPNGGIVEAAFAAALDVRLGGINRYDHDVEDRGTLGDGRTPEPNDVAAAVRLRRHATTAVATALVAGGRVVHAVRSRRSR